ncbi:hypothetical protein OUY22_26255 [Nonomuraea sp. MCN248]|uniref:Tetratricopeptide repeat protein n=1 Tax=Nonomuraea corallina TaxID=2989783 RepID=A0ABT4SII5_9ACTN|nr:hypothetical protein [Nonomuraea corallina]MDA0636925.1 hypothetical protein [Nonomuraea corallina]
MEDRHIELDELAIEIANRATKATGTSLSSIPSLSQLTASGEPSPAMLMSSLAGEMVTHATRLLRERRYRDAAAVFEFGVQGDPYNAAFHNNWGFCLIPEDAHEALPHLQHAEELSYFHSGLNAYNQMCCLVELGRRRAALALAERIWARRHSLPSDKCTIWRHHGSSWVLEPTHDIFRDIAEFAAATADAETTGHEADIWRRRLAESEQQSPGGD